MLISEREKEILVRSRERETAFVTLPASPASFFTRTRTYLGRIGRTGIRQLKQTFLSSLVQPGHAAAESRMRKVLFWNMELLADCACILRTESSYQLNF